MLIWTDDIPVAEADVPTFETEADLVVVCNIEVRDVVTDDVFVITIPACCEVTYDVVAVSVLLAIALLVATPLTDVVVIKAARSELKELIGFVVCEVAAFPISCVEMISSSLTVFGVVNTLLIVVAANVSVAAVIGRTEEVVCVVTAAILLVSVVCCAVATVVDVVLVSIEPTTVVAAGDDVIGIVDCKEESIAVVKD